MGSVLLVGHNGILSAQYSQNQAHRVKESVKYE